MTITGVDNHLQAAYDTSFPVPFRRNPFTAVATSTLLVVKTSTWIGSGFPGPGATPPAGSGAACTRTTSGALPMPDAVGGKRVYLNYLNFLSAGQPVFEVHDRLLHTSGLVGNVTTEQAVASAALPTRATGGLLVTPYLEVYTATGATTTNVTLKYTNQAGDTGKTAVTSGVTLNTIGRFVPLNLAAGDTGVRVVESIQLSASTGGAGNFGVTLTRLKAWMSAAGANFVALPQNPTEQGGAAIDDDACLMVSGLYNANATTLIDGLLSFIQA